MKQIKYATMVLLAGAMLLFSCKKWLTVRPKTEVTQKVLFTSESGFKDALVGVYMLLKSGELYGGEMIYGTMERLVGSWDFTSASVEQYLALMNYGNEEVQQKFSTIFSAQYKTIANVNQILSQLDQQKNVFRSEVTFGMIKSECLAIRAFCHLDMLRLFGPVPTSVPDTKILPYVKTLSTTPNSHLTYNEFKILLLQDLIDAELLIKDIDPFLTYSAAELARPGDASLSDFNPESDFDAYRFIRFNYYAVKGLQARAYHWFGQEDKAYESALSVIQAKNRNGTAKFPLGTPSSYTSGDMNLATEQLIGLYDHNLKAKYDANFAAGVLKKGTSSATVNTQLYGNTGSDMREISLWTLITNSVGAQAYIMKKYNPTSTLSAHSLARYMIPLVRVSEMYFIAVEAAPVGEKQQWWNQYRQARNLTVSTLPSSEVQLKIDLAKEFHREFIGEGQPFFNYKRVDAIKSNIIWAQSAAAINYVVPLPLTEFTR